MKKCEDIRPLLVGLLDHELTDEETREVNDHLVRCAACRAEHERLRETSGRLEALSYQEPTDAIIAQVWRKPYSRLSWTASWLLILCGYACVIGFGVVQFLRDRRGELVPKMGVAAIVVGFLILLIQVVRERVKTYKTDPYKEIER